jgi:hypothetical protein
MEERKDRGKRVYEGNTELRKISHGTLMNNLRIRNIKMNEDIMYLKNLIRILSNDILCDLPYPSLGSDTESRISHILNTMR